MTSKSHLKSKIEQQQYEIEILKIELKTTTLERDGYREALHSLVSSDEPSVPDRQCINQKAHGEHYWVSSPARPATAEDFHCNGVKAHPGTQIGRQGIHPAQYGQIDVETFEADEPFEAPAKPIFEEERLRVAKVTGADFFVYGA